MRLRQWQAECIEAVLAHYQVNSHFLCLATPGAGKTVMSANVAARLLAAGHIDYVLCFSPSIEIAGGLQAAFERTLGRRFDGLVGSLGGSYTYQSLQTLQADFWELFDHHKVLVVFDEVHHCSGVELGATNAWGRAIIENIQSRARYTLALSGTPWRSDRTPITLSQYGGSDRSINCDYVYGLREAVNDGVCRKPKIVLVDNAGIKLQSSDGERQSFGSFKELLATPLVSYQSILNNDRAMTHLLGLGVAKLISIRQASPAAGGLVVASSVSHARQLLSVLRDTYQQSAVLVSHKNPDAHQIIKNFRTSSTEWIVSVGMVSEGTDIPRLQICCHLSWVKTELYFRQVMGRILRVNGAADEEAWLYTLAEPSLAEYAHRVDEDLPEHRVIFDAPKEDASGPPLAICLETPAVGTGSDSGELGMSFPGIFAEAAGSGATGVLIGEPEYTVSIDLLGQYRQQVIDVFDSSELLA